jgi:hypothetical protein
LAKESNLVNWFAAVLVVALLIAVAASAALYASNQQLQADKNAASTQAQMAAALNQGQAAVQKELMRISALLTGLSQNCTEMGLSGPAVRAQLNLTMAADAFITSAITVNAAGIVMAAEPASIEHIVGMNLSSSENIALCLSSRLPVLGNVLQPAQGEAGAPMDLPVFDRSGTFQGAVNALCNVSALMSASLPQYSAGTSFTWWAMQSNGTDIYDTDQAQIGMNVLGPEYADFPQLQALVWKMVNQTAGYGTYSYYSTLASGQVVTKECFWAPTGLFGTSWRVVIVHRL